MARFADKVCIITGGAGDIGAKTAEMFAEQGGRVLITDVDDETGLMLSNEINMRWCGDDRIHAL